MEGVSGYILSVISAALVLGILGDLLPKNGGMGKLYRLIGGLFLSFTIISPVVKLDFSNVFNFYDDFLLKGERYSESGMSDADQMYRSIIKSQTEAYILDKAELYQAEIGAEVILSEEDIPVPCAVQLIGSASPYAKKQLSEVMERELGIAKENQKWIESCCLKR